MKLFALLLLTYFASQMALLTILWWMSGFNDNDHETDE